MPDYKVEESQMEQIQHPGLDKAFIIRNAALESILFNRNLVNLEFTQACENATVAFLRHFAPELRSLFDEGIAELMLLSKGLYYWMHNAFARVFEKNLEINFAATRRVDVSGDSARISVPYYNFDAPAPHLLIGDVIASGATISTALSLYQEHYELKSVYVFSLAGSVVGGQALTAYCKARKIDLTVAYGLAAFGLAPNGFDLSFLHPDTITSQDYRDRAERVFQGKPISAVGWDCGSQAQSLRKYKMLCWLEAEYWGLQNSSVFQLTEQPDEPWLVEKEYNAYREHISHHDLFHVQQITPETVDHSQQGL